jgi:chloramphenicol 3-O phosphotransferase
MGELGQIVVLNGVPRAGKTSIAAVIQAEFAGVWMNLGVDSWIRCTPERLYPGVGLRPGGERPDLEAFVPLLYAGLYEAIAAQARLGINVVVDVDHHEIYSTPLDILPACARRLAGLDVLFVGVRCPIDVIWSRREQTWGQRPEVDAGMTASVERCQVAVHDHGPYDLEVDTSVLTPAQCAAAIRTLLEHGPPAVAFERLRGA